MDTVQSTNLASSRISGPMLMAARAAWVLLAMLALIRMFASLLLGYNTFHLDVPEFISVVVAKYNLPLYTLVSLQVVFGAAATLVFFILAAFIIGRRSGDWMGLVTSLFFILQGAEIISPVHGVAALAARIPAWQAVETILGISLFITLFLFFSVFPTGRFVPGWIQWPALIGLGIAVLFLYMPFELIARFPLFELLLALALFGGVIFSQVYRYLRVSSRLERQQTKWFLYAIFINLFIQFFHFRLLMPVLAVLEVSAGVLYMILVSDIILANLSLLVVPLLVGLAILRYRLWDIDVIIRRTLIYGSLTAILALVYLGSVIIIQGLFIRLTGRVQSELATVLTTLAIAALFTPLRRGIQTVIDRRFYRRKYDAERILAEFSRSLRDEVDLAALRERLLSVVEDALHPDHASLWLSKK
jgi:hypothetical protein